MNAPRNPSGKTPGDASDGADPTVSASDKTVIVASARVPRGKVPAAATASAASATSGTSAQAGQNVLPAGTRLGEFEILGLIGEGGFGIVYVAHDTSLGRNVALKEYMPSALASRVSATQVQVKSERHESTFRAGLQSFINEARLLAQFDHHSLVKVYRFWEANGTAYMVMPLYQGATLKEALKSMTAPPDERWLHALLAPLLEALTVLHAARCYHRDIAPDNIILLDGSNRPVLLDFGAARRVIGDMTQALTVILKPGYAPIEQYAEVPSLKQGPWSDQYALAAVVYYAITGKTPPPAVGRLVSDSYQPLARLAAGKYSERFLRAVDHALAVMPADRPQTARQFAGELGVVLDEAAAGSGSASAPRPQTADVAKARRPAAAKSKASTGSLARPDDSGSRPASQRLGMGIAAAALSVAAIGVAWWFMAGRSSPVLPMPAHHLAGDAASAALPGLDTAPGVAASNSVDTLTGGHASSASNASGAAAAGQPALPARNERSASTAPYGASGTIASGVPPSASALPPFTASGEFERIAALADPAIQVKVEVPTPRAVIGRDKLNFALVSSHAGYVYVFAVDPANHYLQLFPNDLDSDNRIARARRLVLPRATWQMEAGDPPGSNQFLAIVSPVPRDFSALGMTHESVFASLSEAAQNTAAAGRSGTYSPFAGVAACREGTSACPHEYGAATFKIDIVRSSK
jgi:serine/threonine protein kinase